MRSHRRLLLASALLLLPLASCKRSTQQPRTLLDERSGFVTRAVDRQEREGAPEVPPPELLSLVRYPSRVGPLAAYVTPRPASPQRRPAIVWLFGGFSNGIGSTAWEPAPRENDQSARAFREAGLVMMYPSLRGGNDNPGQREAFYGEVLDVLAAADYLATLDYVDPSRIYLGGHSTGGTLALLTAAASARFRAVFAFGPVADVRGYRKFLPFDPEEAEEVYFRSPMFFTKLIRTPTFVIEGAEGNAAALPYLSEEAGGAPLHTFEVSGANHFDVLAALTPLIAQKLRTDTGPTCNVTLTAAELAAGMRLARSAP